ncbi:MAG: polysaccharide biosynthesis tyrosine autokinase, partial [Anaerolineae bacterium]|nr:polysaccharide biosynthesis tyrosine autokinase [Anaerolineae bacterium]
MELKRYLLAIKKWWWLLAISTLVATVSGYFAVSRMPRIYQASTSLMVGQSLSEANPTNQDLYISTQLAQTYREIVRRQPILSGAAEALGLSYVPRAEDVSAWLVPGTQLLGIAVRDTDPERARALADAIAQQLIQQTPNEIEEDQARQGFVRTQLLSLEGNIESTEEEILAEQARLDAANSARAIQQYQANIQALQEKLSSYQATYASLMQSVEGRTNYIEVFEPATASRTPVSPRVMETVLLAAASGFLLAVGGIVLIEFLDDTVKSAEEMKQLTGLSVLGTVSRIPGAGSDEKLLQLEGTPFPILEAYRTLRTNLLVSSVDKPIQTLVVTSPAPRDGKSTTVANIGVIMAQAGNSVILVDADLRRSALHKAFQLSNRQGLTNVLLESEPVLDGWLQETGIDNLRLLSSGPLPPNPPELLGSQKMHRLFETLIQEADLIIFDSPPILAVTDATVLSMTADGVLVVADAEKTRRGALKEAVEKLRQADANILGTVLNRVPLRGSEYTYYHYDYYGHRKRRRGLVGRMRRSAGKPETG